jgi:hypothetical protein
MYPFNLIPEYGELNAENDGCSNSALDYSLHNLESIYALLSSEQHELLETGDD